MGFNNPRIPWSELERILSGRRAYGDPHDDPSLRQRPSTPTQQRQRRRPTGVPYAELHAHTNFSFLDGASDPEAMVNEADQLGLTALAITDHDGFYGVVRFAEAARVTELPTVYGSELTLGLTASPQGRPDPGGDHLLVLARNPQGYARLAAVMSAAHLAGGEKGKPDYSQVSWPDRHGDDWVILTGCRKGAVPRALATSGIEGATRELARLIDNFGRHNVAVELWDDGGPLDTDRNDALADIAHRADVPIVATGNAHYATPREHRLASAVAAVRARRSLDDLEGWLPAWANRALRSGDEQARRFARWPGAVATAAELGAACAFDLRLVAPQLPPFDCPDGLTEMAYLRRLCEQGARKRYGPRDAPTDARAYPQIDRELDLIEHLGFPGYFLVVWDIVEFCHRQNIYCQGRGSAANSVVCYSLDITKADPVKLNLVFERFLSLERDGPPDIDLDIESGRREEAIQYLYQRHGRHHVAQVANVVTYRPKSAVRDMARALGYSPGQQDAFSKHLDSWHPLGTDDKDRASDVPDEVLDLAIQVQRAPRHLGIHSGGMVICDRPIIEVCPVEPARKKDRTVLQWDKDDCAAIGLVKFDLLGLGMLEALHGMVDLLSAAHGIEVDLATLPQDDSVYDMLCRADSVGVFQVESRAQMATLPRLRPRKFYDLVVEVALIRPGPIQGGSVHPYIRRRNGQETISYAHPLLERSLKKTLGVPLFQEQLMQIAIDVGGFTASDADQLRQAMSSKRSRERMAMLRQRFSDGGTRKGVPTHTIDEIWETLAAFADYGFPESHAISFAYLVYASAWFKRFYPAAFCAALLNAQPMGFYSPHSLAQDARRHGVEILRPDVNASEATATLETNEKTLLQAVDGEAPPTRWGEDGPKLRLGLGTVRLIGPDLAERISAGRPYASPSDLAERTGATAPQLEALATAGALSSFGDDRHAALWVAGAAAQNARGRLPGIVTGSEAPSLPPMSPEDLTRADLWASGIDTDGHPTRHIRAELDQRGVVTAAGLTEARPGSTVLVAGIVTHRQRPETAGGVTFMSLEDETGFINIVVSPTCWKRHRRVAQGSPGLVIRGRVERAEGVTNLIAQHFSPLTLPASTPSRDFR